MKQLIIENIRIIADPLNPEIWTGFAILVENGLIQMISTPGELLSLYPAAERLDGKSAWCLPGLIDAHTHLYAALTNGMPGPKTAPRNFPQVLANVWWPFDRALGEEDIYVSALTGSLASLRRGITTILDHHSSPNCTPDSLSVLACGIRQVGLRACLAFEVTDRNGPDLRNAGIQENVRFIKETNGYHDNLLCGLFGLHAAFSLTDETLINCAGFGEDLETGFHLHMAEHRAEVERFAEQHAASIAETYHRLGILGDKTILAHTVHITDKDIQLLRETGTFNVHNPHSNLGNGVGMAPIARMMDLGQPVGLGSDGFYDLPDEMEYARLTAIARAGDPSVFSGSQALQMVYGHNAAYATRIFRQPMGQIAPGFAADMILVRYEPFTPVNETSIGAHLTTALAGGVIESAVVGGKVVMKDGIILGIDEPLLRERARTAATSLWKRFEDESSSQSAELNVE